jgi:subtilisin family serine protease
MDLAIRISLYGALALLLVAANLWFVDRLLGAIGRPLAADRMAPFVIVGKADEGGRLAAGMPEMLNAHLRRIGAEIDEAIGALTRPGTVTRAAEGATWVPAADLRVEVRPIEASLAELRSFVPPDIKLAVGGVEFGGLISWLHGWLVADRVLRVAVVYHDSGTSVSGRVGERSAFDFHFGQADVGAPARDDAIAEMIAYGLMHQEYRRSVPVFGALTVRDFRRLLSAVAAVGALNQRVAFGRTPRPSEYAAPLEDLLDLAEITRNWEPLVRLAAEVAENAGRIDTAIELYEAERALVREADAVRAREIAERLESLRGRLEARRVAEAPAPEMVAASVDERIRSLLGAEGHPPGLVRIGIAGGRPSAAVSATVLGASGEAEGDAVAFFDSLAATIRLVAPDAELVFHAPTTRSGHALRSTDIQASLEALAGHGLDVVLVPFGPLTGAPWEEAFTGLADQGRLVVLSAGNDAGRALPFAGSALLERMMVVAAVDLDGNPAAFSTRGEGAFWAPGERIPVRPGQVDSGTAFAAALAAAVAAGVRAAHPDLGPEELVEALRAAAAPHTAGGPPILNLQRTVEQLGAPS